MMFLAISNLIRFRKFGSPILSAAKVLSLVAALLSLLTLQSALIDRFGHGAGFFPADDDAADRQRGLRGGADYRRVDAAPPADNQREWH